jgi:hypothetical protein
MSSTSRSKRQSGWLPVLIAVATGTGGTATWWVTVNGPVCQPPGQLAGVAEVVGVTGADALWLWVGGGEPGWLGRPAPEGADVVAHEAVPAATIAAPAISAPSLSGISVLMGYLPVRTSSA